MVRHNMFAAAFVTPVMHVRSDAAENSTCSARKATRRDTLRQFAFVAAGTVGAMLQSPPGLAAKETPSLPGGAAQFSRLLAAQRQWNSLSAVVNGDRELGDDEWESLRAYLRTIYSISGDMDYIAKGWDKPLRVRGDELVKNFRVTVKGMDKPAIAKDRAMFATMHSEVAKSFEKFFGLLKEASTKDIPDEL